MKKNIILVCVLIVVVMLSCVSNQSSPPAQSGGLPLLDFYESNPDYFRTLASGAFSENPSDAPTDAELNRMLSFAMTPESGHGLTSWHFVIVRDYEEQKKIFGPVTNPSVGLPTPGTVTVLIFADNLSTMERRSEPYTDWYMRTIYALYDTGASAALFKIAAYSMGYKTHTYLGLNIPRAGTTPEGMLMFDRNAYAKYLTSKDGKVDFSHSVGLYTQQGASREIKASGNLDFICAKLVGKAAVAGSYPVTRPDIDARTGASTMFKGRNFNFWDPQDGSAYGKGVPAGQPVPTDPADVISNATLITP